jgi:hypothetical protein
MSEMELTCSECGNKLESIPQHCGQDMIYNEEKEQFECYMGPNCGYMSLDEVLCGSCREECQD